MTHFNNTKDIESWIELCSLSTYFYSKDDIILSNDKKTIVDSKNGNQLVLLTEECKFPIGIENYPDYFKILLKRQGETLQNVAQQKDSQSINDSASHVYKLSVWLCLVSLGKIPINISEIITNDIMSISQIKTNNSHNTYDIVKWMQNIEKVGEIVEMLPSHVYLSKNRYYDTTKNAITLDCENVSVQCHGGIIYNENENTNAERYVCDLLKEIPNRKIPTLVLTTPDKMYIWEHTFKEFRETKQFIYKKSETCNFSNLIVCPLAHKDKIIDDMINTKVNHYRLILDNVCITNTQSEHFKHIWIFDRRLENINKSIQQLTAVSNLGPRYDYSWSNIVKKCKTNINPESDDNAGKCINTIKYCNYWLNYIGDEKTKVVQTQLNVHKNVPKITAMPLYKQLIEKQRCQKSLTQTKTIIKSFVTRKKQFMNKQLVVMQNLCNWIESFLGTKELEESKKLNEPKKLEEPNEIEKQPITAELCLNSYENRLNDDVTRQEYTELCKKHKYWKNKYNTKQIELENLCKKSSFYKSLLRKLKTKDLGSCAICLDNLSEQNLGMTRCGHFFCYSCLCNYLDSAGSDVELLCPHRCMPLQKDKIYHIQFPYTPIDIDFAKITNEYGIKFSTMLKILSCESSCESKTCDKYIVYIHWNDIAHLFSNLCKELGLSASIFKGHILQKRKILQNFYNDETKILILTKSFIAHDVNLSVCSNIIFFSPFTQHISQQEKNIISKIKNKDITVTRLFIEESMEEQLYKNSSYYKSHTTIGL